ncbi:cell adhesion molecule CEACAM6-like [Pituophis catenifer annectens]|uniref:cell adhesion molecule CEACAM6-like n=1 Tax=Pituophis catenifer annectens TaxID=94852 RepID=UPI00399284AD
MEKGPFALGGKLPYLAAQVTKYNLPVFMNPSNAIEGDRINLTIGSASTAFIICNWYRGADSQKNLIVTVYLPPLSGNVFGSAYTGRETVGPNCSLHIENLNQDDSGTYTVTKDGPSVHGKGELSVEVLAPGLLPKPSMSIVQLFRENMDSVHLKCDTTVRFANIIWLQNGKPLNACRRIQLSNNNQTLTIQPVLRRDAGAYQCHISNPLSGQRSDTTTISVIYGPEVPVISPNNACNERHINIILTCRAASYPEPQYTWFRNGVWIDSGPKLFIENFNENQTGIYVCEAMNELLQKRSRSNVQHIRLKESCVSNVTISGPSEGIEGKDISLDCTAKGDEVQYSWMKENQPVDEDEHISFANNNQTLNFHPCHRADAAKYKCHAHNDYSSDESDFFGLSIVYGPDAPFINETVDINQEKISLMCVAVAFPATENKWFFNGELVPDNPEVLILEIISNNSGNYTCRATNPRSKLTRETSLEIDMIERRTSLRRR